MAVLRTETTAEGILVWDDRDPDRPIYLHRAHTVDLPTVDRVITNRAQWRSETAADARFDAYVNRARAEIEQIKIALGPARLAMTDKQISQCLLGSRKTVFEPLPA